MAKKMNTVKKQAQATKKSYVIRIEATGFDTEVRTFGSEAELEGFIASLWPLIEGLDNGEAVEAPAPKAKSKSKGSGSKTVTYKGKEYTYDFDRALYDEVKARKGMWDESITKRTAPKKYREMIDRIYSVMSKEQGYC